MDLAEGAVAALDGMQRLLAPPDAPAMLVKVDGPALTGVGSSPATLFQGLEALGYSCYLVEPGRLTLVASGRIQDSLVADCLALKRRPAGLDGWEFRPTPAGGQT
jgi:hypothetical protein